MTDVSLPDHTDRRDPLRRIAEFAADVTGLAHGAITFVDGPASRLLAGTEADRSVVHDRLDDVVARTGAPLILGDLSEAVRADVRVGALAGVDLVGLDHELQGAYLGVPLRDPSGAVLGALSVNDPAPRILHDRHARLMRDLSSIAGDQLDLIRRAEALDDEHDAELALIAAIAAGEILPWYQPIIDLRTERVIGVEALARHRLSSGETLGADSFIPIAERTDLIVQLDLAIIRQALADLGRWHQIDPALRVSLNLSGRHLDHDDWAEVIKTAAQEAGVSADRIDLELTETARPTDMESGRAMVKRVRELGFLIWFDDFGTGWSALQDLLELPVDGIKIDRSFAAVLGNAGEDAIVRALVGGAGELGLKVTIEGVETEEQARLARELGCDHAQGWLWSPAVPADELEALLQQLPPGSPFPRAVPGRTP